MKKLMILGASRYMEGFVRRALQEYEVIVVSPEIPENISALPAKMYYVDVMDRDRVLEIAMAEKIDGITTEQAERPVRTVAYVAEKLGLPGNPYDVACLFTDKTAMRDKLVEAGIPVLPYRIVKTLEEAQAALEEIGVPAIVKPADSRGSRGITKIESAENLGEAFSIAVTESLSDTAFVERYASGHELVVEAIALNGSCSTIAVGDSLPFSMEEVFSPKERVMPSRISAEDTERVRTLNTRILDAFGLQNGISQSEYILSNDGEIFFIESCARCGGMFVGADLTSVASGIDTASFMIKTAMGEQQFLPVAHDTGKVCAYVAFYLPFGTVIDVEGLEDVRNLPFIRTGVLEPIEVGMQTKPIVDKTARYCVVVEADGYEEYEARKAVVKSLLKVKVATEDGVQGPIWD